MPSRPWRIKMKIKSVWIVPGFLTCIMLFLIVSNATAQENVDSLMDQLQEEYEKVMPPSPTSSVNSDYPVRQTAVGVFYSAKLMSHLIKQNQILSGKYDQTLKINQDLINKFSLMLKQNKEIIKLLKIIAENLEKPE